MKLSHEEKSAIETLIKIADTSGARERVATGWVDWNIHIAKGVVERLGPAGPVSCEQCGSSELYGPGGQPERLRHRPDCSTRRADILEAARDLTEEQLAAEENFWSSDDSAIGLGDYLGPIEMRERRALLRRVFDEVRRRREAMDLLVAWVDHEDILGGDCTDRCPACMLKRVNEGGPVSLPTIKGAL